MAQKLGDKRRISTKVGEIAIGRRDETGYKGPGSLEATKPGFMVKPQVFARTQSLNFFAGRHRRAKKFKVELFCRPRGGGKGGREKAKSTFVN